MVSEIVTLLSGRSGAPLVRPLISLFRFSGIAGRVLENDFNAIAMKLK